MRKVTSWSVLFLLAASFVAASLLCSCGSGAAATVRSGTTTRSMPTITWLQPAAITNPTPLSAVQLDAIASVPGIFVYTPPIGMVLAAGSQTLSVTFTPTDTTDFNTATASVTLTVNPAAPAKTTPAITWLQPAPITNPAPLSGVQLDAAASVPGTFVYTPPMGTVLAAGPQTLSVTFTPTDTIDFNTATALVTLTVSPAAPAKTIPAVTWLQPAPITNPTPLSATQLDATASVPGTFAYMPPAGTVLAAGTQTLSVTFTPTDTNDYSYAISSVSITVDPAAVGIKLAVADTSNNRVLFYDSPFATNESASLVLGQPNFIEQARNQATANTLSSPTGLAKDSAGNLYVADSGNCRVLQFQPPFVSYMNASLVIGQSQFNYNPENSCYGSPLTSGMFGPSSVALDGQGNLWVTDPNFGRVTEYVPPFTIGMAPTLAIGQPSLESTYACNGENLGKGDTYPSPTSSSLCEPFAATFDSKGDLWVADMANQRVLEFVPPFSTGMAASLELGQPAATAFTSNGFDTISASSLHAPNALTFDSEGNLWVADTSNSRVLKFASPFTNGQAATTVIGQADFTHSTQYGSNPSGNRLYGPVGLTFDTGGNLIVSDNQNNRVLIFVPPFSNGMIAATAIGQPDLTGGAENQGDYSVPTARTLWSPYGAVTF